jgi:hypothetical protein
MFPTHLRVGAIPVSNMLLREPTRHRVGQHSRIVGELMAFPARRTMVGHQHNLMLGTSEPSAGAALSSICGSNGSTTPSASSLRIRIGRGMRQIQ